MNQPPKILFLRAYFAHNDKATLYGYEGEDTVYNTIDKSWCQKPTFLNHFMVKEIGPEDLKDVILHDLLLPEDFMALQQRGLIDADLEAWYSKIQSLKDQLNLAQTGAINTQAGTSDPDSGVEVITKSDHIEQITGPIKNALDALKETVSNSVFAKIKSGTTGMTEQERAIIDLVEKHLFG